MEYNLGLIFPIKFLKAHYQFSQSHQGALAYIHMT